ncbi:MAG: hypothetical protein ACOCUL_00865 [Bacteroidota bacterium]
MKNIIIFGGKGNGTVLLNTLIDINKSEKKYNIIGFVNNQWKSIQTIEGFPVLGDIEHLDELIQKYNASFINCISSVNTMNIVEELFDDKYTKIQKRLISIIHPTANIGQNVKIGKGCFIGPQTYIGQNSNISDHCFIHAQCYIARDSCLGKYNYLAPKVYIGAEVETQNSVYFGVGSLIKERLKIGKQAIIGMGAIIVNNINSKDKYFGEKAIKRN